MMSRSQTAGRSQTAVHITNSFPSSPSVSFYLGAEYMCSYYFLSTVLDPPGVLSLLYTETKADTLPVCMYIDYNLAHVYLL